MLRKLIESKLEQKTDRKTLEIKPRILSERTVILLQATAGLLVGA
jgi:hypothetical protein